MEQRTHPEPRLVGSTGQLYRGSITECTSEPIFFKSSQWSPDGTTVLCSSADKTLRSFVLPVDLIDGHMPHSLHPYSHHCLPESCTTTCFHPSFTLQEPSTTLFLACPQDLPIRLLSPFSSSILASYPLVSPTTEKYIAPHSLIFSPDNLSQFYAGSNNTISIFDINRYSEGPYVRMRTAASKRSSNDGQSIKGIVKAMSVSPEGLLAAGTYTRWVALYDGCGRGGTVGVFHVNPEEHNTDYHYDKSGSGITQVKWSSCGRYLFVAERCSDGIGVWDVRGAGRKLAWLHGRRADTNQDMAIDVVGNQVWAGGTDGHVRVWEGLGIIEGSVGPSWEFKAHEDAVSAASLHPSGSVLATSSGQRYFPSFDESNDDSTSAASLSPRSIELFDNSLKIWAL